MAQIVKKSMLIYDRVQTRKKYFEIAAFSVILYPIFIQMCVFRLLIFFLLLSTTLEDIQYSKIKK